MHRMIFEDFKRLSPNTEIHFACPWQYHDAVRDHPFVDHILGMDDIAREDYILSYNTTTACGRYEMRMSPYADKHRADIWADHCGVPLTSHDMHFRLTEEEKAEGKRLIEYYRFCDGPSVLVSPISAMPSKNLTEAQMLDLVRGLKERGLYPFGLHTSSIFPFLKNDIPTICKPKLRHWLAIVNQADYVVSVDTATFHCAGGMSKPLVGIFTFVDGLVYGKYFDFFLVQKHRKFDPDWTCGPCYNWGVCPKSKESIKPCLTELTSEMILEKVDLMLEKWPI